MKSTQLSYSSNRKWLLLFILVAALCGTMFTGCGKNNDYGPINFTDEYRMPIIQNSHKVISGDYQLQGARDEYAPKESTSIVIYSFSNNGEFIRTRQTGSIISDTVKGTYLIGTGNELILYIEIANGRQLDAARIEQYTIKSHTDTQIILSCPRNDNLILNRR